MASVDGIATPQQNADRQLTPAAQYVRMSTEHQQYSTENQADIIRDYAAKRGFQIVQTYADDGKSGLQIKGRNSLKRLIDDVQAGRANFKTILVYDVSRWGRFQDADESAYYEYICRRAGIQVEYCAEQFENDGSIPATIIKTVKRAMAGEYSRELSAKVFKGQCKLIELGFRQGGPAGYGLRRTLVNAAGEPKSVLQRGEQKSLQTDRVILTPGPDDETQMVRRIYEMFTREQLKESQIAAWLNSQGIVHTELQRPWTKGMVHQVLTNEKYIGNNIYNRVSFKLKRKRVRNAPAMWVRAEGAFTAIVKPELFFVARGMILERSRRFTEEELLEKLKQLFLLHGTLSSALINDADDMPSSTAYATRFGSLIKAYQQVGFSPDHDYGFIEINRHLRHLHPSFLNDMVIKLEEMGAVVTRMDESGLLKINDQYTTKVLFTRCRQTQAGAVRWLINLDPASAPDITVVVRMDPDNQIPQDFYLLPRIDLVMPKIRLAQHNGAGTDTHRHESLGFFIALAARATIEVAA